MIEPYGKIKPSIDKKLLYSLIKLISVISFFAILIYVTYMNIIYGDIALYLIFLTAVPLNLYSFAQIISYSKRDVLNITHGGLETSKIKALLKTIFKNIIEMVIIPSYTAFILYVYLVTYVSKGFDTMSLIFVVIYAVQIVPLKVKQSIYTEEARSSIKDATDEIKTTRILLTIADPETKEYERAISRHIAAEELISIHSEFLLYSTSRKSLAIEAMRYMVPILTTVGGIVVRQLLAVI